MRDCVNFIMLNVSVVYYNIYTEKDINYVLVDALL